MPSEKGKSTETWRQSSRWRRNRTDFLFRSHFEFRCHFVSQALMTDFQFLIEVERWRHLSLNSGIHRQNLKDKLSFHIRQPNIEIKIITNNSTVIRAVLLFSEGIFESETFIAYPEDRAVSRIVIPFKIPKDNCYDVNIKVMQSKWEQSNQMTIFFPFFFLLIKRHLLAMKTVNSIMCLN